MKHTIANLMLEDETHTAKSKLHKTKTTYEEKQDNTCELTLTIKQSQFTSQESMRNHKRIKANIMNKS